jgi:microcompartment protein CcmK/EutM
MRRKYVADVLPRHDNNLQSRRDTVGIAHGSREVLMSRMIEVVKQLGMEGHLLMLVQVSTRTPIAERNVTARIGAVVVSIGGVSARNAHQRAETAVGIVVERHERGLMLDHVLPQTAEKHPLDGLLGGRRPVRTLALETLRQHEDVGGWILHTQQNKQETENKQTCCIV